MALLTCCLLVLFSGTGKGAGQEGGGPPRQFPREGVLGSFSVTVAPLSQQADLWVESRVDLTSQHGGERVLNP